MHGILDGLFNRGRKITGNVLQQITRVSLKFASHVLAVGFHLLLELRKLVQQLGGEAGRIVHCRHCGRRS